VVTPDPTFQELLRSCERSALHLELRDGYSTSDPGYVAWQADPSVNPLKWYGSWIGLLAEILERGVVVRRVRVVSEPLSEYIRFEHAITPALNLAAGEEVRWLPRRNTSDLALPGNDFWLFDDRLVMVNHFSGDGQSTGHEVRDDDALVKLCAAAFTAVWERAIPHEDYRPA